MTTQPVYRHWTRREYDRLVELGILHEDERIELIGGHMIVAEPKGSPHQTSIEVTAEVLRTAFGSGWAIRTQGPVALDDESEPEPDVVVVPGRLRDYRADHPSQPVLIVEVADSSVSFDRRYKGSLYARAGIADYWIVNLRRRVLEVYRKPALAPGARFGWRYTTTRTVRESSTVSPLAAPSATIIVADLLP
jgi:Uma2 family endonuclease